ncbi:LOW QUALITY PROTEIN: hypothetical protein KUTeg_013744, partial [Tegillarca granosa]
MSVLKLIGKSLFPVIVKMKAMDEPLDEREMARLKKEHPLTCYTEEDLMGLFEGLTGESVKDVLGVIGKDCTLHNLGILVHLVILHANQVGAPKSQPLRESTYTKGTSGSQDLPSCSGTATSSANNTEHGQTDTSSSATSVDNLENRLKEVERRITSVTGRDAESQVEDYLKYDFGLTTQSYSHVLLAALETLVGVAVKVSHKEAEFFSKAYVHCKRYEDNDDLCGLTMKLFGTSEDKKIDNAVADWNKSMKMGNDPVMIYLRGLLVLVRMSGLMVLPPILITSMALCHFIYLILQGVACFVLFIIGVEDQMK